MARVSGHHIAGRTTSRYAKETVVAVLAVLAVVLGLVLVVLGGAAETARNTAVDRIVLVARAEQLQSTIFPWTVVVLHWVKCPANSAMPEKYCTWAYKAMRLMTMFVFWEKFYFANSYFSDAPHGGANYPQRRARAQVSVMWRKNKPE